MAAPGEEPLLAVEHRYVCSECSQLYGSLEEALLHQQSHLGQEQRYEVVGLAGEAEAGLFQALAVQESSQYQCLECGQLLLSPGELLEHQELHLQRLSQEPEAPAKLPASSQIHYECVECKALFLSQEVWLAHRQAHRAPPEPPAPEAAPAGQSQALVDLEHSYRKPEEAVAGPGGEACAVQLLLYECGECLQLFQTPKDFLEHQATHLGGVPAGEQAEPPAGPAAPPQPAAELPGAAPAPSEPSVAASDHSYELKNGPEPAAAAARRPKRGGQEPWCAECQQPFPSAHQLQLHLQCHRQGAFQCPLCSKVLPSPLALRQHRSQHSGESRYLCLDCGLAFDTEAVLLAHRRGHSPNPLHRCPCGKAFLNMTKFLYHRRSHGPLPPAPPPPEAPPRKPEDVVPLAIIYSVESAEAHGPSFCCLMCSKVFAKHLQLVRHQRFVHKLERRHKCQACGKMFKKKSHVRSHLLTHTGERPFRCPECGKSFNSQANQLRHRLTHTGERPYRCEVCQKAFTQSSTLQQHRLVHSRRFPYKCPECGVDFHRPYRLLMHRYHHTGEYPYKCPECGRSFLLRRLLDVHRLSHAGREPQVCTACGAAFVTALQLREHKCGKASRRFECPTCGKKVSSAARLRAHELLHAGAAGAAPPEEAPAPPPAAPRAPPARLPQELRVLRLQEALQHGDLAAGSPAHPHRGAALPLPGLRQGLPAVHPPQGPPAPAHRREALQVRGVRQGLHHRRAAGRAPPHPHRRAPLPLRRLRQGLSLLLQPLETPQAARAAAPAERAGGPGRSRRPGGRRCPRLRQHPDHHGDDRDLPRCGHRARGRPPGERSAGRGL
ncbi:unnamed protein product, partial [Eretmochelys imbricata]